MQELSPIIRAEDLGVHIRPHHVLIQDYVQPDFDCCNVATTAYTSLTVDTGSAAGVSNWRLQGFTWYDASH